MSGPRSRLDTVEKGISELENRCKEITQNSGKEERGLKTKREGLEGIAVNIEKVQYLLEGEKRKGSGEATDEETMTDNFMEAMKDPQTLVPGRTVSTRQD